MLFACQYSSGACFAHWTLQQRRNQAQSISHGWCDTVVSCEARNGSSHSGTQLHRSQAPGYGSGQSSHSTVPCPVPVPTLSPTDARHRRVSTARQSACTCDAAAVCSAHRKHFTTHAHAAQPWLQRSVTLKPSFPAGTSQSSRCNAVEQSAFFLQLRPIFAFSLLRALSSSRPPSPALQSCSPCACADLFWKGLAKGTYGLQAFALVTPRHVCCLHQ